MIVTFWAWWSGGIDGLKVSKKKKKGDILKFKKSSPNAALKSYIINNIYLKDFFYINVICWD